MPKARDKSIRLDDIGCNADEKALAEQVAAMAGLTTKVLKYALIKIATQGRVSIKSKAGTLGLTVDQYRCYLEAQELDPSMADQLRGKWAKANEALDRKVNAPATV